MNGLFQFEKELAWEDAGPGVKRQLFGYGETLMMIKVKFEAGSIGARHSHPHVQATYIESGIFEMTIGDEVRTISKGDGYFVPSNMEHGIRCIEAGMLIDSFSPMREDFITTK
ncbi:cupin domain-containing protein [Mucilaginibacter straminoryzae]